MKTETNVRYILRITLTLLAIALVVAAALAVANELTAPAIERSLYEKTQDAIKQVLPAGAEPIDFDAQDSMVSKVYKGEEGYAVEVTPLGFDNTITMIVGVDFDGKVLGLSIISHTESAGLGAVAADKGPRGEAFREQFVGMSGSVAVTKDNGSVDSITGATVTSRAICDGVNAALACVSALEGGAA